MESTMTGATTEGIRLDMGDCIDCIDWIVFDRPESANSLSHDMLEYP